MEVDDTLGSKKALRDSSSAFYSYSMNPKLWYGMGVPWCANETNHFLVLAASNSICPAEGLWNGM